MRYYSTNNRSATVTLQEAIMRGLANDGGLFMPERLPRFPKAFIDNIADMTLQELSFAVASFALQDDIDANALHSIVNDTLNFDIPLKHIDSNKFVLELFHGPTMTFKDIGARFCARLLAHFNASRGQEYINVLISTSGNSGGAMANAFLNIPGVRVFIVYPHDRLSHIQEAQFTTAGNNITAIEVNGTIDDCRNMVLQAFADEELNRTMTLTSTTTLNIARLLPQVFFYFHAYAQLRQPLLKQNAHHNGIRGKLTFAVPCGNLGNLTAALMAKRMGLPIERVIATESINCPFVHYLNTSQLVDMETIPTLATAIDIGKPRNLPRVLDMYDYDHAKLCQDVSGLAVNDRQIIDTISKTWHEHRYMLDPNSATAYYGMLRLLRDDETGVALATAHPARYPDVVEAATGKIGDTPVSLLRFMQGTAHVIKLNNGYNSLRNFLLNNAQ